MSLTPSYGADLLQRIDWDTRTVRDGRNLWGDWNARSQGVMHRVYNWTLFERRIDHNDARKFTIRAVLR